MDAVAPVAPTPAGELPPGPRSAGVVQTLRWFFQPIPFIESCREEYGEIFTVRLGPDRNVVVIAEPEVARGVIAGPPDVYRAGDANGLLRPVVGHHSLLVLDGDEHLRHRRILLPAFAASHAAGFAERVRGIAEARVAGWRQGQELALHREMEQISFEAILGVALGAEPPERVERLRTLVPEMMRRCASPFTILPYFRKELGGITPYAGLRRVLDQLDELFLAAIRERRQGGSADGDALSMLVAATGVDGAPLGEREIRDELLTLIMAGYETTTSALAWSFERLLRAPDVMSELVEHLDEGDESYVDAVVKETLRMRPVVPVVARKVNREVSVGEYLVPAGTVLMASIYLLHRDPLLFEDPDEFRPERFLEHEEEGGAWVPFGGGVRRCLGASFAQVEMKVVLKAVLGTVTLRAPDPEDEPVARRRFTFAPKHEARAVVESTTPQPA